MEKQNICLICGLSLKLDVSQQWRKDQLYTNAQSKDIIWTNGNRHSACIEQIKLNKENKNE